MRARTSGSIPQRLRVPDAQKSDPFPSSYPGLDDREVKEMSAIARQWKGFMERNMYSLENTIPFAVKENRDWLIGELISTFPQEVKEAFSGKPRSIMGYIIKNYVKLLGRKSSSVAESKTKTDASRPLRESTKPMGNIQGPAKSAPVKAPPVPSNSNSTGAQSKDKVPDYKAMIENKILQAKLEQEKARKNVEKSTLQEELKQKVLRDETVTIQRETQRKNLEALTKRETDFRSTKEKLELMISN